MQAADRGMWAAGGEARRLLARLALGLGHDLQVGTALQQLLLHLRTMEAQRLDLNVWIDGRPRVLGVCVHRFGV